MASSTRGWGSKVGEGCLYGTGASSGTPSVGPALTTSPVGGSVEQPPSRRPRILEPLPGRPADAHQDPDAVGPLIRPVLSAAHPSARSVTGRPATHPSGSPGAQPGCGDRRPPRRSGSHTAGTRSSARWSPDRGGRRAVGPSAMHLAWTRFSDRSRHRTRFRWQLTPHPSGSGYGADRSLRAPYALGACATSDGRRPALGRRCGTVKQLSSSADTTAMATPREPGALDSPRAHVLRAEYRCLMCVKRCFIPCRLSTSAFLALVDGTDPGPLAREGSGWE